MDKDIRKRIGECAQFKKYRSIEEYKEDILFCLMYGSWKYSEGRAREIMKEEEGYIKEAFSDKESAWSCMAEIGFHCG